MLPCNSFRQIICILPTLTYLLLTLPSLTVDCVDKSNFKTCDQSSFCKRQRSLQPTDKSSYVVKADSIKLDGGHFTSLLVNTQDGNIGFSLELFSLKDGNIRLRVDEFKKTRHRFGAEDALDGPPTTAKFEIVSKDDTGIALKTDENNRAILHFKPFRLDIYAQGDLVISLNARGLLNFEHFRTRPGGDGGTHADAAAGSEDTENNDGLLKRMWRPLVNLRDGIVDRLSPNDGGDVPGALVDHHESDVDKKGAKSEHCDPAVDPHCEDDTMDYDDDDDDVDSQDDQPPLPEVPKDQEGMWEENFKSHEDRKPFGPSSVGMDISFIGFDHVYGLPEHADSFVLRTTTGTEPYRLYNLDVFEYELNNPMALYGSVPYMIAHSVSKTVGVFWLNAAEGWVDIHSSTADQGYLRALVDKFRSSAQTPQVDTQWMFESGLIDVFIVLGPRPADVFRQYAGLTGTTELPPLFSIAYHQCRWNYNDQEDVRGVHQGFEEHDIPFDVLWLDIEHTDGKRYFTWDKNKFPEPIAMQNELAAKGRKTVVIVDPHIKKDDNYKVYKEAMDNHYFVKNRDGGEYDGWCWPGASAYLDFMNPVVQDYWAKHFSLENYEGSTESLFVWNDMNEPSVFNGPEITMHKDAKHFDGWEHRDIHNIYGFYQHKSTHKGLLLRSQHRIRPFVLTRAFFIGSQRYAAVWTGDNNAAWDHLKISIPMLLTLSVSGIPFVGADVGGFFNNPDEELLTRWYQTGAWSPFFRAHAHLDTRRREPWLYSESTKNIIRQAIQTRYRFLPYWYTLFYEHIQTGMPVMRPLWAEFPEDTFSLDEEKQFMIGGGILVRPVTESSQSKVSVYLPDEGTVWYDIDDHQHYRGPGAIWIDTPMTKTPVFFRGGHIVVTRERPRRSSQLMAQDPFTLFVALDYGGTFSNGSLYLDDGYSYAYQSGHYLVRHFNYNGTMMRGGSLTSKNAAPTNTNFATNAWIERVVILGIRFNPERVSIKYNNGEKFLDFKYTIEKMSLTIRRPGVKINTNFELIVKN